MKTTKKQTANCAEKQSSNAKSNANNKNYFEMFEYFSIVRNEKTNGKFKIAFANYILEKSYESIEEAKQAIEQKNWDMLIDTVGVIFHLLTNKEETK